MLSNKVYDIIKYITLTLVPAVILFISTVGTDIGIQDPVTITKIISAVGVLMGSLVGISAHVHNKAVEGPDENEYVYNEQNMDYHKGED